MELQENKAPCGSQSGTPTKITSPHSSTENSVGRLTRQSSIQTLSDNRPLPPRITSEEFDAISQQIKSISLEEAKDHLQNLGPVPTKPDRVEETNRKLVVQEEARAIRREAVSFLKRRTLERQAKLTNQATLNIPTLTITSEVGRDLLASSATPGKMATSSGTPSNGGQDNQTRGVRAATTYTGPTEIRGPALTPRQEQTVASHADPPPMHASWGAGPGRLAFPPHVSNVAQPLEYSGGRGSRPVTSTSWASNPYAENTGTPPATALRAMGHFSWQTQGAGLPIPPVVPSQNQPVSLEWLYSAPGRSPLASIASSRNTTPELVRSSGESERAKKKVGEAEDRGASGSSESPQQ
ncbi:hypothetical protein NHQ30_011487 [Ciborinia camelliae]|nr:hypothetical protein NHQ30_011487 [Ciborinia camelliae]